jgi:hypothetical protein
MTKEELEQIKKEEKRANRISRLVLLGFSLFMAGVVAYTVISNMKQKTTATQKQNKKDFESKQNDKKTTFYISEYNKRLYAMNRTKER